MLNKAIILAAGQGTRLRKLTKNNPKCLLKIGKDTLIESMVEKLNFFKIKDIVIVTGYQSHKIKNKLGSKARYLRYPNYKYTNNLHTLLFASEELNKPTLCLFADVLFSKKIILLLSKNKKKICLAVDTKKRLKTTMRVKIKKNSIIDIGSHIKPRLSDGNFIGFGKFSKVGCQLIKKSLNSFKRKNFQSYYTEVIRKLIKEKIKINYVDVSQYYWKEIDTVNDYKESKKINFKIEKNEKK